MKNKTLIYTILLLVITFSINVEVFAISRLEELFSISEGHIVSGGRSYFNNWHGLDTKHITPYWGFVEKDSNGVVQTNTDGSYKMLVDCFDPYCAMYSKSLENKFSTPVQTLQLNKINVSDIYCIDPNLSSNINNVYVKRHFIDGNPFDEGLLRILQLGEENNYGLSNENHYAALLFAIRAYTSGFWQAAEGSGTNLTDTYGYLGTAGGYLPNSNEYYPSIFMNLAKEYVNNWQNDARMAWLENYIKWLTGKTELSSEFSNNEVKKYADAIDADPGNNWNYYNRGTLDYSNSKVPYNQYYEIDYNLDLDYQNILDTATPVELDTTQRIANVAEYLFAEAIIAAGKISSNENTSNGFTMTSVDSSTSSESSRTLTFKPTGLASELSLEEIVLDFASTSNIENVEIIQDGRTLDDLTRSYQYNNTNILSGVSYNKSEEVEVKIVYEKSSSTVCSPNKLNVEYKYKDSLNTGSFVILSGTPGASGANGISSLQRFVVYVPTDYVTKNDIVNITMCESSCNSESDMAGDCTDFDDFDHVIDPEEGSWVSGSVTGPDETYGCIVPLDNTSITRDDAGNSYKVGKVCEYSVSLTDGDDNKYNLYQEGTNNKMSDLDDNQFCSIYCTEDYAEIRMPGIQEVDSGRYFRLAMEIEGTKSCYTNKIDNDLLDEKLAEALVTLAAAATEYSRWTAGVSHGSVATNFTDGTINAYKDGPKVDAANCNKCSPAGCEKNCPPVAEGETSDCTPCSDSGCTNSCTQVVGSCLVDSENSCTSWQLSGWNYTSYSVSGGKIQVGSGFSSSMNATDGSSGSNSKSSTSTGAYSCGGCTSDSKANITTKISNSQKAALDNLITAQKAYNDILDEYSACLDWETGFEIVPTIEYDYGKTDITNPAAAYKDSYIQLLSPSDRELMLINNIPSNRYADHINKYCVGGYDEKNCDNEKPIATTIPYCTTSGCSNTNVDIVKTIVKADYVSSSVTHEMLYGTENLFYTETHTGTVLTFDTDEDFKNFVKEHNIQLLNGLPIELDTEAGLYEFSLTIDNLGEYYDTCTAGRLIDSDTKADSVDDVLRENDFTGTFVCKYRVNCPDCPLTWDFNTISKACPTCVFEYTFRTISLNNFDPNDKDMPINWNYKYDVSDTKFGFISYKAFETLFGDLNLGEIDTETIIFGGNGEEVYGEDPILTVNLTPAMASDIRGYNNTHEYDNNTLKCIDYNSENQNVFCYSELLTEWSKEYDENFVFTNLRDESHKTWKGYFTPLLKPNDFADDDGGISWK